MQSQGESLTLTDAIPTVVDPAAAGEEEVITPKHKLDAVQALKTQQLEVGDTWYVVDHAWYAGWESACGGRPFKGAPEHEDFVGSVDNTPLSTRQIGRLKRDLLEGVDYELVPETVWALFVEWYVNPARDVGSSTDAPTPLGTVSPRTRTLVKSLWRA